MIVQKVADQKSSFILVLLNLDTKPWYFGYKCTVNCKFVKTFKLKNDPLIVLLFYLVV